MALANGKSKIAFQLRVVGKDLEIRALSYFGETRAETSAPSLDLLNAWLEHFPGDIPYQTQQKVGAALHNKLITGQIASLVSHVFHEGQQQKQPVHFELRFDQDQVALAQFPWEILANATGKFLVRDGVVDISRYIAYPQTPTDLQINFRDKSLLHIISQPESLSLTSTISPLLVKLETLEHASLEQFTRKLLIEHVRDRIWGIQFDGQGMLRLQCLACGTNNKIRNNRCQICGVSLAALAFANTGAVEWVSISEIGTILYNAQVQMALLLACEISRHENAITFGDLAPELVLSGVPAIVGMQYPFSKAFRQDFINAFYTNLLQNGDLLAALRAARQMNIRDAWYSPVLYLRHQPEPTLMRIEPTYHTRSVDTAVPAQVNPSTTFLVRLWIRRPQTKPATEQQLKRELNISENVPVFIEKGQVDVKFDPVPQFQPVEQRILRRGEVMVQLIAMGGKVEPAQMTLFIDEYQDAPPAIFSVTTRHMGTMPLEFSLWQDGGKISSLSHVIEIVSQQIDGYSWKESSIPVPVARDPQIIFLSELERSRAEELYKLCLTYFSLEELRELCFELNVDYDSLGNTTE
jgi:hypothetical protein